MIEHDGPGAVALGAGDRALAVAAVKAVLRVASDAEDALVAVLAETALGLAEQFIGRVGIARPMRETLPASRAWQALGAAPVRTIAGAELPDGTPLAAQDFAVDNRRGGRGVGPHARCRRPARGGALHRGHGGRLGPRCPRRCGRAWCCWRRTCSKRAMPRNRRPPR